MQQDNLYRELNDSSCIMRFLEGFDPEKIRVLVDHEKRAGDWSMAVSFFQGADSLRKIVHQQHGYDIFQREYAMLFLYRHSIELFLKHTILNEARGHNLEQLLKQLTTQVQEETGIDISLSWFAMEIVALSKLDPTAQGFRYSLDLQGNPSLRTSFYVDLEDLGKRMNSLYSVFWRICLGRGDFSPVQNDE